MKTGFIGGRLADSMLGQIGPGGLQGGHCSGQAYDGRSKLEVLLGSGIWDSLAGKVVVDFGCGSGRDAVEMASHGARKVIGIDIRPQALAEARAAADRAGVGDRCVFATETAERCDVVVTLDGFEHFSDAAGALSFMRGLLRSDGCVLAAFGPTWFHPFGGHLFSVFPWAHLIFTEASLIRWRSGFKTDGATRFGEVEGGLNQMTIRRFKSLVDQSAFRFASFEPVPIRRARLAWNRVTQEFLTSIVRCKLVPRSP